MLSLVERKASGMSWPAATHPNTNFDNLVRKSGGGDMILRRTVEHDTPKPSRHRSVWQRNSKGLLCALGQFGCSDSYYSPDTIGTWKFHRVARPR